MSKLVNFGKSKVCYACLQLKPKEQFNTSKLAGYTKYCKDCGVKPGSYRAEARYNQFMDYN